jgi:spermidine/putrescine transport system permease protein
VAGWVMSFALSFDDFLISFFTAGPDTVTLPLALYSSIKFGMSPSVFAMASLVFIVSFISACVLAQLSKTGTATRPAH